MIKCVQKDKPSENQHRLGIAKSHTPSPAYKQRLRQAMDSLVIKKREGFRNALIGGCWHGKSDGRLSRIRAS